MASPTCTLKNSKIRNVKSKGYEAKINRSRPVTRSRQRRRTEKAAITLLDKQIRLRALRRASAIKQIRNAKKPLTKAKQLIRHYSRSTLYKENTGSIDLSDVQELRVKLIRRDGGIFPPQTDCLSKLEIQIIEGEVLKKEFQETAAEILNMPQVLSKACFLLEWEN
ncbi:MAG: hypothetical protein VW802_15590 [Rhodospirillaceae bacterium]